MILCGFFVFGVCMLVVYYVMWLWCVCFRCISSSEMVVGVMLGMCWVWLMVCGCMCLSFCCILVDSLCMLV